MKMVWGGMAAALLALPWVAARAGEEKPPAPPANAIKMEFQDAPIKTVIDQLSESRCGTAIIQTTPLDGRVTITSKQQLNVDEAITLLNSILKDKGFIGVRTDKILKIIKIEDAKKYNIPVQHGSDPVPIKANDDMITQVIPIKYVDAVQLKKDFAPLMSQYGDLSSNASSNVLILTDTGSNIKRFMEIIAALDTQSSTTTEIKVFQLKYASATNAARLINEIFRTDTPGQQQNGAGGFLQRFGFGGGRGGGGGGGGGGGNPFGGGPGGGGGGGDASANEPSHRALKVSASADDRTSNVVVSAPTDTMIVIAGIIKDLDSNPNAEQGVFIYRLKNAQSRNLEAILNSPHSLAPRAEAAARAPRQPPAPPPTARRLAPAAAHRVAPAAAEAAALAAAAEAVAAVRALAAAAAAPPPQPRPLMAAAASAAAAAVPRRRGHHGRVPGAATTAGMISPARSSSLRTTTRIR